MKWFRYLWSYCQKCMDRRDFIMVDGTLVCEVCGNPLTSGKHKRTFVPLTNR